MAVDGLFRGVTLAPGPHEVEFKYASRTLGTGVTITAFSSLLVAAAGIRLLLRRGR
jgi:hypothetical protein